MKQDCPLNDDVLVVMHDVARLIRTRFDQRAKAFGMTRAQWIILLRLDRQPGLSQNELAAICEVEPITVGRLIDRLEKQGLVERRADPEDRRIRRLHLQSSATPLLAKIKTHREALRDDIMSCMGEEDSHALLRALLQIKEKMTTDSAGLKSAAGGAG